MGVNKFNCEGYYDPTAYEALTKIEQEAKALRAFRPVVYICSPLAGDMLKNQENARTYCRFAVEAGCVPIAPHIYFTQFMNDNDRRERDLALFIDYRCVITYKDESTGLSLTHPLTISFSRVVNGSGIVDLLVTTPNGNVFKNEEVASLTAKAELWRGSTVDTTKVSYKWAVMDASVTATSSTGYDADFGIGWRKLSDTADKYSGTATNTLTVYAAAVDSYAVFKCCAQDTDSASASYNTKFFDVATFIDNSDPLQIIVTSTGGDVFKNGQGTTVLTAVCYQAGSEVDAAGNGSYTWTKYNKDGVVDTSWGTNGSKTGKTLSVSSTDVDTKATFMVVVAL